MDMIDETIGDYTLVRKVGRTNRTSVYLVRCKCGFEKERRLDNVKRNPVCTHVRRPRPKDPVRETMRNIWRGMKDRCYNPRNQAYEYYGGRGIEISDAWMDFERFSLIWARDLHMHIRSTGSLTIEAIPRTIVDGRPLTSKVATDHRVSRLLTTVK